MLISIYCVYAKYPVFFYKMNDERFQAIMIMGEIVGQLPTESVLDYLFEESVYVNHWLHFFRQQEYDEFTREYNILVAFRYMRRFVDITNQQELIKALDTQFTDIWIPLLSYIATRSYRIQYYAILYVCMTMGLIERIDHRSILRGELVEEVEYYGGVNVVNAANRLVDLYDSQVEAERQAEADTHVETDVE